MSTTWRCQRILKQRQRFDDITNHRRDEFFQDVGSQKQLEVHTSCAPPPPSLPLSLSEFIHVTHAIFFILQKIGTNLTGHVHHQILVTFFSIAILKRENEEAYLKWTAHLITV